MKKQIAGRYEIQEEIGRGGMGVVYKAWDAKLLCTVALKSVSPDSARSTDARRAILKEARTAASLNHPYICRIFDTVEDGESLYVVMEYCDGRTLEGLECSPEEAIRYGCEIAEALSEAHSKGTIHRDIKPANVMLTTNGHVKIMDFGLARALPGRGPLAGDALSVTATNVGAGGAIVGSIPYMSPEQLRGEPADERSDIFSLGALLYELLTGARPFSKASAAQTIAAILSDRPEPMSRRRPGLPENLEAVLQRMLAKDPAERHQSAADVLAALGQASRPGLPTDLPLKKARDWRRRPVWIPAALVFLAAVAFWWIYQNRRSPEVHPPPGEADMQLQMALRSSSEFSQSSSANAIARLEKSLLLKPDSAEAHSALALEMLKKVWWYQGDSHEIPVAMKHAEEAVKLDSANVQAKAILAIGRTLSSPDRGGYRDLAMCLKLDPRQSEALAWLALFFVKTGDFPAAQGLIDRLKAAKTESPYAGALQAMLYVQKRDMASSEKQINSLSALYPTWEGTAFLIMQRALVLPELSRPVLVKKAIEELQIINREKPSIKLWRMYLKSLEHSPISAADRQALEPLLREDHELSALYARVCSRLGEVDSAVLWLEHSIAKGNFNLVELDQDDFKPLEGNPRFARLKHELQKTISVMIVELRNLIFPGRKPA